MSRAGLTSLCHETEVSGHLGWIPAFQLAEILNLAVECLVVITKLLDEGLRIDAEVSIMWFGGEGAEWIVRFTSQLSFWLAVL